jgi:hypothetical protein
MTVTVQPRSHVTVTITVTATSLCCQDNALRCRCHPFRESLRRSPGGGSRGCLLPTDGGGHGGAERRRKKGGAKSRKPRAGRRLRCCSEAGARVVRAAKPIAFAAARRPPKKFSRERERDALGRSLASWSAGRPLAASSFSSPPRYASRPFALPSSRSCGLLIGRRGDFIFLSRERGPPGRAFRR